MKKYIKFLGILFIFLIFAYNFCFANFIPSSIENKKQENLTEYKKTEIIINNNILEYEIGFYNTIHSSYIFDIKLNFKNEFHGKLNIYENIKYNSNKKKLYKSFSINNKSNVFQVKAKNDLIFIIEDKFAAKKELEGIVYKYSESLYLSDTLNECNNRYICTNNLNYSKLSLLSFRNIIINKELNDTEIDILLEYIYKGGQINLNESLFSKFFQNTIIKQLGKEINGNSIDYGLGGVNIILGNSDQNREELNYYDNLTLPQISTNDEFLLDDTVKSILIDKNIKKKFLNYWTILIFICLYIIIIIPINYILKKKSGNKLFFVYSIPIISLLFTISLIIINIIVKGITDIENTLELNIIKNGKVYQQIYNLTFTPNGGDYQVLLDYDDTYKNNLYYYNYNYNKNKKWDIINNKFAINFENIKSSQILGFRYGRIKDYKENYFDINYIKTYTNWNDFSKDYINLEENQDSYYRGDYKNIIGAENNQFNFPQIKKIGVSKIIDEKYNNKYSLGGNSGYKLRVDIYYDNY